MRHAAGKVDLLGEAEATDPVEALELHFPDGLIGYPEWQRFTLEPLAEAPSLALLHCHAVEGLTFIVGDPHLWLPDYAFDVRQDDLQSLGADDPGILVPLVILTLEAEPLSVTANMLGPLLVNPETRRGRQVIQSERPYTARHPLAPEGMLLTFPEGLVGAPDWKHFMLQWIDEEEGMGVLQSLDAPPLSFPVIDPRQINPEYRPKLSPEDRRALGTPPEEALLWLCILNVQQESLLISANLLGPLAINAEKGLARQVILSGSGYAADYVLIEQNAEPSEVDRARPDATR